MRSQRLIACLQLLQGERKVTARYLAERLDVSMRTVYRDVDALCEAGVPVHMERGPLGGIVLADGYRRALAQFTNDELLALFADGAGPLADLGIAARPDALRKLAGALPQQQREAAIATRAQVLLDHNRWARDEQPTALLRELRRAVSERRRVRLRYRDRGGEYSERLVDPLGLVAKAGIWYLIARQAEKGYRTFRVQRIDAADATAERFTRPTDFELEAYWQSAVASIERRPDAACTVIVRGARSALASFARYWQPTIVEADDESITLRVAFSSRDVAIAEIIMFDGELEIVSPGDLGAAIVASAQRIIERYGADRCSARVRPRRTGHHQGSA